MNTADRIVNLNTSPSGIKEAMAGPWEDITIDVVDGEEVVLATDGVEHAGFVLSGVVEVTSDSGERFTLRRGGAFAIPVGGSVTLSSAGRATYLHVVLRVGH